ncbi:hypothetical protein B0H12DRAFT_1151716 [Mycena haematopus]|nr:hypothetical protein B0H12DRAFT_1151716 [Mycena haematopus]
MCRLSITFAVSPTVCFSAHRCRVVHRFRGDRRMRLRVNVGLALCETCEAVVVEC